MKLEAGMLLRVQTKTKDDVFGNCLWNLEAVGLEIKSAENPSKTVNNGVKCVLLGGSGPAARAGYSVLDTEPRILADIQTGISEIVSEAEKVRIMANFKYKASDGTGRGATHGGTGVVDFN